MKLATALVLALPLFVQALPGLKGANNKALKKRRERRVKRRESSNTSTVSPTFLSVTSLVDPVLTTTLKLLQRLSLPLMMV